MNPFRDTIVASPWASTPVDITEIHNSVYDECLDGLEQVRTAGRSAALLIHGEAGSGKTHLLSRLRTRLTPQAPIATDRKESLFVWCRLQTSPRMLWRTLRRTIVEDWFRPVPGGKSQIDRILFHRLAAIRPAEWDLEPWYEYMLDEDQPGLMKLIEQIADTLNLNHNLTVAFRHLAFGEYRRELRAWLAGTSLPESVLNRMELACEDGTEEEMEDHARQIVLMLCQLTGPSLPILLSFDQVEALQTRPDDSEGLFAFGQAVSTLHDQTSNVFVVSCVQSSFVTELKQHVRGADLDRLTSQGSFALKPLNHAQALQLITLRRGDAIPPKSEAETAPVFWPLEESEFEALLQNGSISPRQLLNLCAERFDAPGETTPIFEGPPESHAQQIAEFLQDQLENEIEEKARSNTPDRTEELVQHGLPLLVDLLSPETHLVYDQELPDVSLVFETRQGRLGLSVCTQSNMNSLAARFKRLKTQVGFNRLKRLVVIRDDRIPISETARKARQYLEELEQLHTTVVSPSTEALAALDALRDLVSNSKSGDLAFRGETIQPQTVADWLRKHLPRSLRDLTETVLGRLKNLEAETDSMTQAREAISALLSREPILTVEQAALQLQQSVAQTLALVRSFPEQIGLLGEPPDTIFRRTEPSEPNDGTQ